MRLLRGKLPKYIGLNSAEECEYLGEDWQCGVYIGAKRALPEVRTPMARRRATLPSRVQQKKNDAPVLH